MSQNDKPKTIALGITGGIAAYKTVSLVRLLTGAGMTVYPIMSEWATRFVGPLTFETLTGQPVRSETPSSNDPSAIEHIALIRKVDLLLIAPLTAQTAAKMAHGLADNFLTTTYLAHHGKTMVCPAMNTAMLNHPATLRNLEQLRQDGVHLCMGASGDLACGETGAGRMAEPEDIFDEISSVITDPLPGIAGKRALVTAGPTVEDIDPVRFISNRSSGLMGFSVARALRNAGARVTLVHGPVQLARPRLMETIAVRTAAEMAEAVLDRQPDMDIIVKAAAVADYSPNYAEQKLKKDHFSGHLELSRTRDILATLGERKPVHQVLAGFAAETETVIAHAAAKAKRKNTDVIFANDVSTGKVFGQPTNHLIAVDLDGRSEDLGSGPKEALAVTLVAKLASISSSKSNG